MTSNEVGGRRRLGQYEVIELIGEGGMGQVFKAHHFETGRSVAIKLFHHAGAGDPDQLKRFRREAEAARTLNHPGLVRLLDHALDQDPPYLVFDLVEGKDLFEVLGEEGRIDAARALALAVQVADAVGVLHENGIVHRDLKPGNIRIRPGDDVCVLDLGIAKHFGGATRTLDQVTRHGEALGTLPYMPPEAFRAELDPAYDVWAIGVILYEMIAGTRPFHEAEQAGTATLLDAIATATFPPLSSSCPTAPRELDDLIDQLVTPRATRLADARLAAREIRRAQATLAGPARHHVGQRSRKVTVAPAHTSTDHAQRQAGHRALTGGVTGVARARRWLAPVVVGFALLAVAWFQIRRPPEEPMVASPASPVHFTSGTVAPQINLGDLASRLGSRLGQTRHQLDVDWLRSFLRDRAGLLRSAAGKQDLAAMFRAHLDRLQILNDLTTFLPRSRAYFGDSSVPAGLRLSLRNALCDVELLEFLFEEHEMGWILPERVQGCAGEWDERAEERLPSLGLERARVFVRSAKGAEQRYFPGNTLKDRWVLPPRKTTEALLLWFAATRWAPSIVLDVRVDGRYRRLFRQVPGSQGQRPVRVRATTWEVGGEVRKDIDLTVLGTPNFDASRTFLAGWLPSDLGRNPDSVLDVSIRLIELPEAHARPANPALIDRLLCVMEPKR